MARVHFQFVWTIAVLAGFLRAAEPARDSPPTAAAMPGDDQAARAVRDLGDPSFAVRQQATEFLWRLGPVAEPALLQAFASDDPEVRVRARAILDRFRYGLFANTDPASAALINRFRAGDAGVQREVMVQLVKRGALKSILALAAAERNAELRSEWETHADDVLLAVVPPLLARGETRQAEELLRAGAQTADGMRHWSAYLSLAGKLDDEISRGSADGSDSKESLQRRTFQLRAHGDLDEASETAAQVSSELLGELLYEGRNWPVLARLHDERILRERLGADLEALGYAAAYHRLAGNQREFAKTISSIRDFAKRQEGHGWYAAEALLVNGQVDDALELMVPDNRAAAFQVRCVQQRYREAFELAGVPYPHGLTPSWFEQVVQRAEMPSRDSDERFRLAIYAARLLRDLGQPDAAANALEMMAAGTLSDRDGRRIRSIVEAECKLGLTAAALQHAAVSLAKDTHPYALSLLLPEEPAAARHWWDYFRQHAPELEIEERLRRVWGLLGPDEADRLGDRAADELIASAREKAQAYDSETRQMWLETLARTCLHLGKRPTARGFYEAAAATSVDAALKVGDLWSEDQRWEQAAEWYEKACQLQPQNALALYLRGQALVRAGRPAEGQTFMARAKLLPLAGRSRHDLAAGMETHGFVEDAAEQWQLILRTGPFRQWQVFDAAKRTGNAVCATDPLTAAACWESMLLSCLSRRMAFIEIGGYIQIPFVIHKARARGLLAIGRNPDALQEIRLCQRYHPGDPSLAEDLVPVLETAGLPAEAEELFQSTFTHLHEICHDFPLSALHHNNLAWMAARCNRQLDEALRLARRAVELNPSSAAYLDTLAEVSYRLGQVEDAIGYEQRCVELEPDSPHYAAQLNRFRAAGDPRKTQAGRAAERNREG